jgi:hypothetical protein
MNCHLGDQSALGVEASENGGKHRYPTKAKSGGHVDDLAVRIKPAEGELARLREKRQVTLPGQPSTLTRGYRAERRERTDKQSNRRVYIHDGDSNSDPDNAVYVTARHPLP